MKAKTIIMILLILWAAYLIIFNAGQVGISLLPGVTLSLPVFVFGLVFLVIGFFLPVLLKKK